jgi:ABC-type glycerol-3-phosphate transport system substrate-binding protein
VPRSCQPLTPAPTAPHAHPPPASCEAENASHQHHPTKPVPAIAKHPDAAWTYATWFCEDQQLGDWLRLWGGNPTARPKLNGTQDVSGEYAEYRKAHLAQLQGGKYRFSPTPKNQRQSELLNQLIQPGLAPVWRGERSVRAGLQELEAPVAALLAEPLAVTR